MTARSMKGEHVTGIFLADVQTQQGRQASVFGLIACASLFLLGVYSLVKAPPPEPIEEMSGGVRVAFFLTCLVCAPLAGFALAFRIGRRPGLQLIGARFTEAGVETGVGYAGLDAVSPEGNWKDMRQRKVREVQWTCGSRLDATELAFVIALKEWAMLPGSYFVERVTLSTSDRRYELRNGMSFGDTNVNRLVAMNGGEFFLLGGPGVIPYRETLTCLELVRAALTNAATHVRFSCTLNLLSRTTSFAHSAAFGMIGGVVSALVDAHRARGYRNQLQEHRAFDAVFTDRLSTFVASNGWRLAVNNQEVSAE